MFEGVTVVVPVGPLPRHSMYLNAAIDSIVKQSMKPAQTLFIDDMADMTHVYMEGCTPEIYRNPWRLGVPASFNVGVALARTDLVFLMGADDTLEPHCLERCYEAFHAYQHEWKELSCFCPVIRYMDTGETQDLPCNAMLVTKQLWRHTGGFPVESAVGACDTMFHSIMLAHNNAGIVVQMHGEPLYNYRRSLMTETAAKGHPGWQTAIFAVRDRVTEEWTEPVWGRLDGVAA